MRKIILASASPQRKKLLKLTGIKFSVRPGRVKEIQAIETTCAALVKKNALLKAKEIAAKAKDAVVIGADTVVYLGGKWLVGKPRNMAEAKGMLKILSRRPQWVYTGLAVIDTKTRKTLLGCECTKVLMNPLSDDEINRYYRHLSPMDKSGGFNIEGRGGVFIRRIEGCYSNVIGLPLSRLRMMLKKVNVSILSLALIFFLSGCATEYNLATEKQETLMFTTEKEVKAGESMAQQFDKQFKMDADVDANQRARNILKRIVDVCDRRELVYSIKIINEDKVNAVSLPGGFVYVYRGLLDKVESDDELAGVIAHEVGHITARHSIKKMESLYGYTLLQLLSLQVKNADFANGTQLAFASVFLAYSREDEFEADRLSVKYLKKAGYKPEAMAGFLKKLKILEEKEPSREYSYWRTHPYVSQRIAAANKLISGNLGFKDYLNLSGEER